MSMLPPCSRGGIVRRHSDGFVPSGPHNEAGAASSGSGPITAPPDSSNWVSRASASASNASPGSVVTTPGKLAFGMRTPGSASLTAYSSLMRQTMKRSSVPNWSPAKPNGPAVVQPTSSGSSASMVTASTSPALAPSIETGPVSAWTMPTPSRGMLPALANSSGSRVRSKASRPRNTIRSPGSALATIGISGCRRLMHAGSSAQPTLRSPTTISAAASVTAAGLDSSTMERQVRRPGFIPIPRWSCCISAADSGRGHLHAAGREIPLQCQFQALRERLPYPPLGVAMRLHVEGGEGSGHVGGPAPELARRHRLVQEPGLHGARGVVDSRQSDGLVEVYLRQPRPGEFYPEPGQRHTDSHLVKAEFVIARRADAVVGRQAQQRAHGERVPADGQNHRCLECQQPVGDLGALAQESRGILAALTHHRQVEARTELARAAGDDNDLAGGGGLVEAGVQAVEHVEGQGVGLAVVHGQQAVGFVFGDFEQCGHESLPVGQAASLALPRADGEVAARNPAGIRVAG